MYLTNSFKDIQRATSQ